MTISDLAIRRSVFAWMIMISCIIFGAISLNRLGVSYLPDIDFPTLSVRIAWPGAAPAIMETEIVDRLEKELINVEGTREMLSTVRQGNAEISLEFDIDRDINAAMQEVQTYLAQVRLPLDVEPPQIFKTNPEDSPIIWMGLSGKRSQYELFVYADNVLLDRFKLVPGVGEVMLGGAAERSLRIWVDNNRLRQYDLSVLDLKNAIALQHAESAAGFIEGETTEKNVRFMGEGLTAKDVERMLITRRGNAPIYDATIRIGDVARVEDGLDDTRRVNSISGKPGMSMGIKKQRGTNAVSVGDSILAEVEKVKKAMPEDMTLRTLFDGVKFARQAVGDTQLTLILSILATILVVWLSLGSLSSTFNIILSIPTSVFGTFVILLFSGFTLNLFTLLGLSLAIGIVVDDAIMVLENIVRHFEQGKDRVQAASDGAKQVIFAAIATTMVLLAIFVPIAFMEGIIGKFFFQFAVTISAAVALSTVDAVTLTPMRASRTLVRVENKPRLLKAVDATYQVLTRYYQSSLSFALRRRWIVFTFAPVFLASSYFLFLSLKFEFVPEQDQSQFGISIKTPVGSSLVFTEARVKEAEAILQKQKEIKDYIAIIGGFRGGEANQARVIVVMTDMSQRDISQGQFMQKMQKLLSGVKDIQVRLFDFASRGLTSRGTFPVEFSIQGPEWKGLKKIADAVLADMQKDGLTVGADIDYEEGMPELQVIPRREAAALRGVDMNAFLQTIQASMGGVREGRFTNDGKRYDIRLRLRENQRDQLEDIKKLQVRNNYGELIPLTYIADIKLEKSVQTLSRLNRSRAITVSARVAPEKSQAAAMVNTEKLIQKHLADGYTYRPGGSSKGFADAMQSLWFVLLLGLVTAYIALAIQFNSFIHPISILLAVPFGFSGAFLALFISGQSINLFSMIGMILLAGLATKNSILLVEFVNQYRNEHTPLNETILEAAPLRLRPILMTSLSAIAAATPQALSIGTGAEARIPMAMTIIGGILISMLFSLFIVPIVYSFLARFEYKAENAGISSAM